MSGGRRVALHVLAIVLVCGLVYWPRLGADGFTDSEGHRVVPAWEMRETGDWLVPHMFGQAYLRKPPGINWAIAGSAALLGESEFSARAVSAMAMTLGSLLAYAFAARWFGTRWAPAAGLAHALTPWFWSSGRSAEIESLHNLCVQAVVLLTLDLLLHAPSRREGAGGWARKRAPKATPSNRSNGEPTPPPTPSGRGWRAIALAIAVFAAALTKGPAGAPFLLGALLAPCIVARSWRALAMPLPWLAITAGGMNALWLLSSMASRASAGSPVTQGVSEFLWPSFTHETVLRALAMLPLAFAAALPMSLALLFPFGRDAAAEDSAPADPRRLIAASLAWTFVLGVLSLTVLGVGNVRYAMPGAACIAPGVAYVFAGMGSTFVPARRRIAQTMALGSRWAWPVVLLSGAAIWVFMVEPRRDARSGRESGRELGAALARDALADGRAGATLLADHLIEARPEVLLYAARAAARQGVPLDVRWVPALSGPAGNVTPPDAYLALRTDGDPSESALYSLGRTSSKPVGEWGVHIFRFGLFRSGDAGR